MFKKSTKSTSSRQSIAQIVATSMHKQLVHASSHYWMLIAIGVFRCVSNAPILPITSILKMSGWGQEARQHRPLGCDWEAAWGSRCWVARGGWCTVSGRGSVHRIRPSTSTGTDWTQTPALIYVTSFRGFNWLYFKKERHVGGVSPRVVRRRRRGGGAANQGEGGRGGQWGGRGGGARGGAAPTFR